jgi:hypothetical protein
LRFRLPSILAGVLAALTLAWPLRPARGRAWPAFFAMALLAGMAPWMLAFSTEARGYSIALSLALLASVLLPTLRGYRGAAYALLMTGAIYTHPLAGTILVGHAAAMLLLHRNQFKAFAVAAVGAVALAFAHYLPFGGSLFEAPSWVRSHESYAGFLAGTLRHTAHGWDTPALGSLLLGAVLLSGIVPAWREPRLRIFIVSLATAGALAVLLPMAAPALRQARFAFWLAPLGVVGAYGLTMAWQAERLPRVLRGALRGFVVSLAALWLAANFTALLRIPTSPVLDAMLVIDDRASPDAAVMCLGLGALDSFLLYQPFLGDREFFPVLTMSGYESVRARPATEIWAYVISPDLLRRDAPELGARLHADAIPVQVLPGRLGAVEIYRIRPPTTVAEPDVKAP